MTAMNNKELSRQIGRLRVRTREVKVEQEYYERKQAAPFDGEAFLSYRWTSQTHELWFGRSDKYLVPAAAAAIRSSSSPLQLWEKTKEIRGESEQRLTDIFCSKGKMMLNIPYKFRLEGMWIQEDDWKSEESIITVLETTRVQVQFRAEQHEAILPPGTVAMMSPMTLMQEVGRNARINGVESGIDHVRDVIASLKTPGESAKLLELEPISLQERLKDEAAAQM